MNELWKYIIPAALGLIIGALLFKSCAEPKVVKIPGEPERDTVRLPADTVYLTVTKAVYVQPTKPYAPDPEPEQCCEELKLCSDAWETLSYENWQMGQVVARGELALPWGSVDAEFSMPRYIQDEQDAFRFTAILDRTDSTQIVYQYRDEHWYDRIGFGPYIGYGYPAGWNAGLSVTYTPWKLSELWR